jgi:hypothetical protein
MSAALPSLVAMQNVVVPASEPLDERDGRLSDEEKNDYRADTSVPSASSIELQKRCVALAGRG